MICIEISQPGEPEVLKATERPDPVPGPGEVLIRVAAAGVNRPDVLQRRGAYPPPPGASDIPGLEVAGAIAAAGAGVEGWRTGDAVCALVSGGGYATMCVAPAPQCLRVPATLDLVSAAAIPETFFTVWSNVFDRGRLQGGETVLFHGGTSGIGTTAIQLAVARRATVFATAGSDEKVQACEALGARRAINYRTQDFVEVIRDVTAAEASI
jgi:putative PIG3 family NAD(P)H quinone oxidoreductase